MANVGTDYLGASIDLFRYQKKLADGAIAQLSDEEVRRAPDGGGNSIAVVMKHMAGNMLSRWTDFLTTDGEKPWRHRDQEFIDEFADRAELAAYWERGWAMVFDVVGALGEVDVGRQVLIRAEPHTVLEAVQRQVHHYGYHVGQIVYRARELAGDRWKSLSIPLGESDAYNEALGHRP